MQFLPGAELLAPWQQAPRPRLAKVRCRFFVMMGCSQTLSRCKAVPSSSKAASAQDRRCTDISSLPEAKKKKKAVAFAFVVNFLRQGDLGLNFTVAPRPMGLGFSSLGGRRVPIDSSILWTSPGR